VSIVNWLIIMTNRGTTMNTLSVLAISISALFFSGSFISANAHDHSSAKQELKTQQLVLDQANGLASFDVSVGRGSLNIIGDDSATSITVDAVIGTDTGKDYEFTLTREDGKAILLVKTDASVDLTVRMPKNLALSVSDGSGDMVITNIANDVDVSDGSGSIEISNVSGSLNVSDGSGDILIKSIGSDVKVSDGSGSIMIDSSDGSVGISDGSGDIDTMHISGSVEVSDGSGSTNINDVGGSVSINDGSGDIYVKGVGGVVTISDGSGSITIDDAGALTIEGNGSGDINTSNIRGKISL